jgi:hypothetical protein
MANTLERFGLRPSRQLNGSPFINAQNRYRISSGNSTSIFQGDLVTPLASGTITRAVANTSDVVVGVFNGCFYTDPTTQKPTFSNFYPQSTNASDITDVSGNTQTGISLVQLDVSKSGTAGTYVVQAIDISQNPNNNDVATSNANIMVRINNHFYRQGGTGL